MCPFCSSITPAHRSGPPDLRPLSALRLTEEEWAEYRKASKPSDTYKTFDGNGRTKLRVIGFNEDTKSVLRASNPEGKDYIEVGWSSMDSVVLATSDGVIFKTFGELVCTSSAFKTRDQVVLTLLVPSDLPEFVASHAKEHPWNRLTPEKTDSSDPLEKATAEFHLVDPAPSPHWGTYLTQRKADTDQLSNELSAYSGEDLPFMYEKIESSIDEIIASTDLAEMGDAMHDCIIPLAPDFSDDGWGNVSSAMLLTRIYSPTRPSAVDIYLWIITIARAPHPSSSIAISYYRAHPKISKELKQTVPQSERKLNGFKPILQMGLEDMPPGRRWRAVNARSFDISSFEVSALHQLLFGEGSAKRNGKSEAKSDSEPETPLNARISMIDMMELLLASVGIVFTTTREAGVEDEFTMGEMTWEGVQGSERWLGRNFRRVCDLDPLEGDEKESEDEGADEDEDDYDEDEDEDEDDNYGRSGRREPGCAHQ